MAGSVQIKMNRFDEIKAQVRGARKAAVTVATELVYQEAERRVPVGEGEGAGDLKESLKKRVTPAGTRGSVYVNESYGRFQEYGTVHNPPQPFLRPAAAKAERRFQREFAALLNRLG